MPALPALFDLSGRVALVAGATRGIGRAITQQFIAHGGKVTIAGRDGSACAVFAANLNDVHGTEVAWGHAFDLADPESIDRLAEATTGRWGRLDTLFANSYRAVAGSAATTSDADFIAVLRDNIVHNARLAHAVLPALTLARGNVVFIASASALAPSPAMAAYGIAKGGLLQLMRNLAVEWGSRGVRVNAVAPGMTRTPAVTASLQAERIADCVAGWPIARLGEPDEIAAAAIFLASSAAAFTTGHTLVCDGGRTLLSGNSGLDFS